MYTATQPNYMSLREALRHTDGDVISAFRKYQDVRYLRAARAQWTARFYGEIYHAAGIYRELRNQLFQSDTESAGFLGLKWLYAGINPRKLFTSCSDGSAASGCP